MTIYSLLLSIITGSAIGIIYGLSFLAQKQRTILAFEDENNHPTLQTKINRIIFSILRLVILATLWLYILRSPSFDFAIVITFFFISFWIVLLQRKKHLLQ